MKFVLTLTSCMLSAQALQLPAMGNNHKFLSVKMNKMPSNAFISKVIGVIISISAANSDMLLPSFALADDAFANQGAASGTRVNSDPDSLLRYGLPIENSDVRNIQTSIEYAKANLRTRRPAFAASDLQKCSDLLNKNGEKIVNKMPPEHKEAGIKSLAALKADIGPVEKAIADANVAGQGSEQQLKALERAKEAQGVLANELSNFEGLLVPDGYKRKIPEEFANLPSLQGRAEVEMVIKKPDGSQYDVDGKLYDQVTLTMVIDGYNAPLTGGNFIDLVNKGYYNNKKIDRSDGFVVQLGDNDPGGEVHGYVEGGVLRKIPLEISLKGDKELIYSSTVEDEGRGNAASVLQFQAYGAMGMAREEFDVDSASTQFFWLLFESDLTPAGKNLLDGRYSCFGYTVKNADLLKGVKEGDIIKSAKVIKGNDKLIPGKL